jgi:hypothetical protein
MFLPKTLAKTLNPFSFQGREANGKIGNRIPLLRGNTDYLLILSSTTWLKNKGLFLYVFFIS